MTRNPFDPTFEQLPETLPIFPLPGVLLLPRGRLPLNIFEPRYLAMTEDALAGNRMIGMIQPRACERPQTPPPLYATGCAGRIVAFRETEDGRYLITLAGICRFEVREELPMCRGYRRVVPAWDRFAADLSEDDGPVDRTRLIAGLRPYFHQQGIEANWAAIERTPDERLVNSLAMICPFDALEKQALLEAPCLSERARRLIAMIEMAMLDPPEGGTTAARH